LKIAVNTRLLLKNKLEGIGWFTYESFKRIVQVHPEHEFHFIFDRQWNDEFIFSDNIIPHKISPPARHPLLIYSWYEFALPKLLKTINPEILVSPDAFTSLRSKVKKLTVIHDINFEHYPDQMSTANFKLYKYYTPRIAKNSDRIATVSEFSKQDIINHYHISENKIDVVYNGSNSNFKPVSIEIKTKIKTAFTQGSDYFIFIGALNPRKNLARLFKAFDLFKSSHKSSIKFVIVGEKMYWSKDIKTAYENMTYKDDVIFTGRLEPEDLGNVLGSALAITYASIFEGFGIPIIEAFNAETPVITSNTSSMPEIAGDAALIIDPLSVQNIADAMKSVATDEKLRLKLIEKGRKRKNLFSWDKTADNVWMSIEKTIKN
jgi:glycosyltransferase involved in cell wall biosynthesis